MTRTTNLRQTLLADQHAIRERMALRMKLERRPDAREVGDLLDASEADIQGDLDFALIQMQAKSLANLDAALARLESGRHGLCADCDTPISAQRLSALPFAVRCRTCESAREAARAHRQAAAPTGSLFRDVVGP